MENIRFVEEEEKILTSSTSTLKSTLSYFPSFIGSNETGELIFEFSSSPESFHKSPSKKESEEEFTPDLQKTFSFLEDPIYIAQIMKDENKKK